MNAKRSTLSKSVRFEVFKRDSFKCQYCGRSAPDVLLHVDHIKPVVKGGANGITNLITACADCNLGKGARELSDDSVVAKTKAQLDALQERREQLEMMMDWHRGLASIEDDSVTQVESYISTRFGRSLSDRAKDTLRKWLRNFTVSEILSAADEAGTNYLVREGLDFSKASIDKAFLMVPKIARTERASKEKPYLHDLFKVRSRMKFYWDYDGASALAQLEAAYLSGLSTFTMNRCVSQANRCQQDVFRLIEDAARNTIRD